MPYDENYLRWLESQQVPGAKYSDISPEQQPDVVVPLSDDNQESFGDLKRPENYDEPPNLFPMPNVQSPLNADTAANYNQGLLATLRKQAAAIKPPESSRKSGGSSKSTNSGPKEIESHLDKVDQLPKRASREVKSKYEEYLESLKEQEENARQANMYSNVLRGVDAASASLAGVEPGLAQDIYKEQGQAAQKLIGSIGERRGDIAKAVQAEQLKRDLAAQSETLKRELQAEKLSEQAKREQERMDERRFLTNLMESGRQGRFEQSEGRKGKQFDTTTLSRYQQRAESHPEVKAANERISAMNTLDNVITDALKKGGQSLAALGPLEAKALGERGVLTERDVTRYVQNPQIAKQVYGTYLRWSQGKLQSADAENIRRLNNILKSEAQAQRNRAYDTVSRQYSKSMGVSPEEARELIDTQYQPGRPTEPQASSPQTGGKTVTRKGYNPTTNQTQLIYSDGTSEILSGKR